MVFCGRNNLFLLFYVHINNLGNDKFLFYIDDNFIKKTSFKESFLVNFGNNFCNICKSK